MQDRILAFEKSMTNYEREVKEMEAASATYKKSLKDINVTKDKMDKVA
jgi:hypothetical protein